MSARVLFVDEFRFNVQLLEAKLAMENYDEITVNIGARVLYATKRVGRDCVVMVAKKAKAFSLKKQDLLRCGERFTECFRLSKLLGCQRGTNGVSRSCGIGMAV